MTENGALLYDELQKYDKMRIHNNIIRQNIKDATRRRGCELVTYGIQYIDMRGDMYSDLEVIKTKKKFIKKVISNMREEYNEIVDEIEDIPDDHFSILVIVRLPMGTVVPYVYKIKKLKHIPYWTERNTVRHNNPYFDRDSMIEIWGIVVEKELRFLYKISRIVCEKSIVVVSTDFWGENIKTYRTKRRTLRRVAKNAIVDSDNMKILKRINGKQIFVFLVENYLKIYLLYIKYFIDHTTRVVKCKFVTEDEEIKLMKGEELEDDIVVD